MTKLNWERTNDEKNILQRGRSGVFMLEMPLSWEEVVANLVPEDCVISLKQFVRSVIVAHINQADLPGVPKKLRRHIQDHIDRKGGILEFAKWAADYDAIKKTEARKYEKKKRNVEKVLLHRIAKYELGIVTLDDAIRFVPDFLENQIEDQQSLLRWATLQPDYAIIFGWKKAHLRQYTKRSEAPSRALPPVIAPR